MAVGPFWTQTPAETASTLGCGTEGLTSSEATARLVKYGRNADAQTREAGLQAGQHLEIEPFGVLRLWRLDHRKAPWYGSGGV